MAAVRRTAGQLSLELTENQLSLSLQRSEPRRLPTCEIRNFASCHLLVLLFESVCTADEYHEVMIPPRFTRPPIAYYMLIDV